MTDVTVYTIMHDQLEDKHYDIFSQLNRQISDVRYALAAQVISYMQKRDNNNIANESPISLVYSILKFPCT